MNEFKKFALSATLVAKLDKMEFKVPTPIQLATIPVALQGKDVLGSAQTGTGKTAAFMLPVIEKLMATEKEVALILAPTRELAQQISFFARKLLPPAGIKDALLIGGQPIFKQINQLRKKPRLIVGTPGRVYDHIQRKTLPFGQVGFLVLDEADCMLQIGFSEQLSQIAKYLPKKRQTLMFSATVPSSILKLAHTYLINPERISMGSPKETATNVTQKATFTTSANKYKELTSELDKRAGAVIVFAKTRASTENLAYKLGKEGHSVDYINGNLSQSKRMRVIRFFRQGKNRILVATDVAARGIDIDNVRHVINYDLPQCSEDYIHRIGRTGRGNSTGEALSLVVPSDYRKLAIMKKELKLSIEGLENISLPKEAPRNQRRRRPYNRRRSAR